MVIEALFEFRLIGFCYADVIVSLILAGAAWKAVCLVLCDAEMVFLIAHWYW